MRNEYPRPDFKGESFYSLNGQWDFDFDDFNVGTKEHWFLNHSYSHKIEVPFCFQSELSGIHDTSFHDYMWYHRTFTKPEMKDDERLLIHFEGVDYLAICYVNGFKVGEHTGSNGGFVLDVTDYIKEGENDLVLSCFDPSQDRSIPRGKQDWEEKSHAIFYTRTSGIYKSVWMEVVNEKRISSFYLTTTLDKYTLRFDVKLTTDEGTLSFLIKNDNDEKEFTFNVDKKKKQFVISLPNDFVNERIWSFEHPFLFDLTMTLKDKDGKVTHKVSSYFGFREVGTKDGYVTINQAPVYLKLVLNQGYYPKGLLTAKSIEEMENDIKMMKEMGFNGCRIHQKCEDPYFLYLADKMGFYVFQECASNYGYDKDSPRRMLNEWIDIIKNNYNHPSIIGYTPLNESWGVEGIPYDKEIQSFALSLYDLIHSLDSTRLVVSNDGWEQCKSDLITVHNYGHGKEGDEETYLGFKKALKTRKSILNYDNIRRFILNPGYEDEGQPILLSEFGGIAFNKDTGDGNAWGYTTCKDEKDYVKELTRIYKAIEESDCIVGICYTQLTDVEQEVNGLLTFDRQYKVDPKEIRALNDKLVIK